MIDCGMVILLPLLMAYSLIGESAHEYLGIAMFLLFVEHHIMNAAWWVICSEENIHLPVL